MQGSLLHAEDKHWCRSTRMRILFLFFCFCQKKKVLHVLANAYKYLSFALWDQVCFHLFSAINIMMIVSDLILGSLPLCEKEEKERKKKNYGPFLRLIKIVFHANITIDKRKKNDIQQNNKTQSYLSKTTNKKKLKSDVQMI